MLTMLFLKMSGERTQLELKIFCCRGINAKRRRPTEDSKQLKFLRCQSIAVTLLLRLLPKWCLKTRDIHKKWIPKIIASVLQVPNNMIKNQCQWHLVILLLFFLLTLISRHHQTISKNVVKSRLFGTTGQLATQASLYSFYQLPPNGINMLSISACFENL